MSAQEDYMRIPQAAIHAPRRPPFTNVNMINQQPAGPATTAAKDQQKAPSSPPLPRQNSKTVPPSPPQVIYDTSRSLSFKRVGFLGEGGFARVYEVLDDSSNRLAIKVITKSSLKTKKAKTKLYAEIKIHRSLDHPNIVRFGECFEDSENVYMTLELCQCGSLMDMLRHRKRFTEPEARFFCVQLLGACHYMHSHQVIHRDLKLGNLFLDVNMNVKVGDFGLAALIENPGERKKTICGTPNYIAPEVLFDTANGHSFEVDTWSIGVILYTLIIGRPPFQTKEVKAIYKRIRDNNYEFPADREISNDARELIKWILTPEPQNRPSIQDILNHSFFTAGIVPAYIPTTAQDFAPNFRHITKSMSEVNFERLKKRAMLDMEQPAPISVPAPPTNLTSSKMKSSINSSVTLAQQEREFQKAVQPSSPISALLSSARQPLVVAPGGFEREQPLIRKLQAAAREKDREAASRPLNVNIGGAVHGLQDIREEEEMGRDVRKKELECQKARIVAQMVPGPATSSSAPDHHIEDTENVPPLKADALTDRAKELSLGSSANPAKLSGFDAAAKTLTAALESRAKGKLFRDPALDVDLPDAKVFIVSWVDYCNKYGMGYALTDGSVGVHFNDSTSIVLAADKQHFDYITSKRAGAAYVRKNHTVKEYPEDLKSKVYLLKHFERYIMDRLYGDYDYTYEDMDRTKGMDFVQKYLRMKHVIVFKISYDTLQFNFYDHTKLILSSQGLRVTHINKDYEKTSWTLSEIMARAIQPSSDPAQQKFNQRVVEKLRYCREVLLSITKNANNGQAIESGPGDIPSSDA